MANEVLQKTGTALVWAGGTLSSGTGFTKTSGNDLTLASLADNNARQGVKDDLGATRAAQYAVYLGVEFGTGPAVGAQVEVFWSASPSATAGTGNTGGCTGADAAYFSAAEAELDEHKAGLLYLGSLYATADGNGSFQRQMIGWFRPPERYGMPVVVNKSAQSLHSDTDEHYVAIVPIIDEIQ